MKKRGLSSENGNFIKYEADPEVELAFVLQNALSGDISLVEVLVERYAAGALRLSQATLEAHNCEAPPI